MPGDYSLYLKDMLDSARFIEAQSRNVIAQSLAKDEVLLRALLHALIVIGEAANHIPPDIQERAPAIPWADIVGIRNIIVHGYFAINMPIVWDVIHREIPAMRRHLEALLRDLDQGAAPPAS
ncbi:MAG: hypothetical protein Kow0077_28530 [Anaerolineae bacterium]